MDVKPLSVEYTFTKKLYQTGTNAYVLETRIVSTKGKIISQHMEDVLAYTKKGKYVYFLRVDSCSPVVHMRLIPEVEEPL